VKKDKEKIQIWQNPVEKIIGCVARLGIEVLP